MKQIFFLVFTALLFATSCNVKTESTLDDKSNSQQQKNLESSGIIMKSFETGDISGLDSVVADDFIDHTDRGDVKGRDSLKAMVKMVHSTMKDMKSEKIRELADDDYVFSWMSYSGTSDGSMGMPKGPFSMSAIEVGKYKDGKAIEHWAFMNAQDMMKMMPPPPPPK